MIVTKPSLTIAGDASATETIEEYRSLLGAVA